MSKFRNGLMLVAAVGISAVLGSGIGITASAIDKDNSYTFASAEEMNDFLDEAIEEIEEGKASENMSSTGIFKYLKDADDEKITEAVTKLSFKEVDCPLTTEEQSLINKIAKENGLDFDFVMAVMECESSYRKNLRSPSRDSGIMQINDINLPELRSKLGITNIMDFEQNVRSGCYFLGRLNNKYHDYHKVLMCYNFGEGGARKCWKRGIYSSKYSRKIVNTMNHLKRR